MFAQFRVRYPTGCLISELLTIYHGKYVVRVLIQVDGVTKATGMAVADTIELAEDQARIRALEVMGIHLSWRGQSEAIDPQITGGESSKRTIFSAERFETPHLGNLTTDGSWSSNAIEPSFPERSTNPSPTKATAYPAKSAPEVTDNTDWKRDDYVENSEVAAPDPFGKETEQAVSFISKVTPIASRRHDGEKPALQAREVTAAESIATSTQETAASDPIDLSDAIARTTIEIRRLGWTNKQGSDYLQRTYGKKIRQDLDPEELLDFLKYLQSQPTPPS